MSARNCIDIPDLCYAVHNISYVSHLHINVSQIKPNAHIFIYNIKPNLCPFECDCVCHCILVTVCNTNNNIVLVFLAFVCNVVQLFTVLYHKQQICLHVLMYTNYILAKNRSKITWNISTTTAPHHIIGLYFSLSVLPFFRFYIFHNSLASQSEEDTE